MSSLFILVTTCDKEKGDGSVTPVQGVEFPKGECPCHGCYAKYQLEVTGPVKSTTGDRFKSGETVAEYDSLLSMAVSSDIFKTLPVRGVQKMIIQFGIMLHPNCTASAYSKFNDEILKIVRSK